MRKRQWLIATIVVNLILISLDTTRADRLSCYGHYRLTSPHLDAFARTSARFTDFFSPHIPTFPAHTTMLTGQDVYAHHVTGQSGSYEPAPGVRMLPEILQEHGYFTAAADNLGKWFRRGFETYQEYGWDSPAGGPLRRGEAVANAAIHVLETAAAQGRPFFLFVHFWDPHTPYLPPAPFDRMFYGGAERDPTHHSMEPVWQCEAFRDYFHEWMPGVTDIAFPKAQYDACIAYMDTCLARFLNRVDELDLEQNTAIVMTADHGEELDEHAHWFDHHGLYDTNLRVPLIIRFPGGKHAGATIPGVATMLDLAPTVLDILGHRDIARQEGMQGSSLVRRLWRRGEAARGSRAPVHLTENTWMKKRGIRTTGWKLILPLQTPDIHGHSGVELYNILADPGETMNVAAERHDVVKELTEAVRSHIASRTRKSGLPDPLPLQPIPLRHIGAPREWPATPATTASAEVGCGDFVGYEQAPEQGSADEIGPSG